MTRSNSSLLSWMFGMLFSSSSVNECNISKRHFFFWNHLNISVIFMIFSSLLWVCAPTKGVELLPVSSSLFFLKTRNLSFDSSRKGNSSCCTAHSSTSSAAVTDPPPSSPPKPVAFLLFHFFLPRHFSSPSPFFFVLFLFLLLCFHFYLFFVWFGLVWFLHIDSLTCDLLVSAVCPNGASIASIKTCWPLARADCWPLIGSPMARDQPQIVISRVPIRKIDSKLALLPFMYFFEFF